jgi:hypothetical protein
MVGDILIGPTATLTISWGNCPIDAQLRIIVDGQLRTEWTSGRNGSRRWTLSATQARWCVVEIRNSANKLIALTNPIFLID